jgi:hypothetical protein
MPDTALSDLQQLILAMANLHRINAWLDEGTHPHVYAYEVLAVRWGFRTQDGRCLQVWETRGSTRPLLPKAQLGPRYQAARVAVSKAFRRLEQRGLVQRGYYRDTAGHRALGLTLQPAGARTATQALAHFRPQWEPAYRASLSRGGASGAVL